MANDGILQIKDILNEYSRDIQDGLTDVAQVVGKDATNDLKNTSPKRTGKYKSGWKLQTTKGFGYVECIVYNAKRPQLTHLLERPHADRTGTKTIVPKSSGHIERAEQKAIKEYENKVENIIKNGG